MRTLLAACLVLTLALVRTPRADACFNGAVLATNAWISSLNMAEQAMSLGHADQAFRRTSSVRLRALHPGAYLRADDFGREVIVPSDPELLAGFTSRASRIGYIAAIRLDGRVDWAEGRLDPRVAPEARRHVLDDAIAFLRTLPIQNAVLVRQTVAEAQLAIDPASVPAKTELATLHAHDLMVDAWGYAALARATTDPTLRATATTRCRERAGRGARRICPRGVATSARAAR